MLIPKSYKFSPSLAFDTYPPRSPAEKEQDCEVIVVFQGVEIDKSEYSALASELSQYQFWVIVPNCFPAGRDYLCPENDSLSKILTELANSPNDALNQALKRGIILFGHSAGGMAAFGTLENDQFPTLKAIATYGSNAPLLTKRMQSLPPVLMLSGEKDSIVPKNVSKSAFQKLPGTRKNFIELAGFNHYSLNNSRQPIAAPPESKIADITNQIAIKWVASLVHLFAQTLQSSEEDWLNQLNNDIIQLIRDTEPRIFPSPDSL